MIQKYIYFPTGHETGMKRHIPVIVYSFDLFKDGNRFYLKASTSYESAQRRSGKFLLQKRAVPYTDSFWEDCLDYINKLDKLDEDYADLWRNRKRK
jgi:hypothetical protein